MNAQVKLDFSYKSALNFTNREEYKTFRRMWKEDYLQTIADIRQLKRDFKAAQRKGDWKEQYQIRNALSDKRIDVVDMVKDKAEAAREAQRQYLAQKEAVHG